MLYVPFNDKLGIDSPENCTTIPAFTDKAYAEVWIVWWGLDEYMYPLHAHVLTEELIKEYLTHNDFGLITLNPALDDGAHGEYYEFAIEGEIEDLLKYDSRDYADALEKILEKVEEERQAKFDDWVLEGNTDLIDPDYVSPLDWNPDEEDFPTAR